MASTSSSSVHAEYLSVNSVSAVNVKSFVPRELQLGLDSNNYLTWKEQMLCLLESHDLLGFVNGELVAPEQGKMKSEDYIVWRRKERLVKGWILGAVADDLVRTCLEVDSARHIWLLLEMIYTNLNRGEPPPPADKDKETYAYWGLYKATVRGDWGTSAGILEQDPETDLVKFAYTFGTVLQDAVGRGASLEFVKKLILLMPDELLQFENWKGGTALHIAALTGNTAVARLLVDKIPALLYQPTHDIALRFVDKYPDLARTKHDESTALERLSLRELAFPSGAQFNLWERLIYSCIDLLERPAASEAIPQNNDFEAALDHCVVMLERASKAIPQTSDIEEAALCHDEAPYPSTQSGIKDAAAHTTARVLGELRKWYKILVQKLQFSLLRAIDKLVPHGRRIHTKKLMHEQAIKLLKCLCKNMLSLSEEEAKSIYTSAMMTTARTGIPEVVQEIVETFPLAVYAGVDGHYFFQVAAENRSDKVFNLIYQSRDHRHQYSDLRDSYGNTILHLVAKLAPPLRLNLVSGAALQMQRELQWFKEVENFVHPYARELINKDKKTPRMIFTEEHKKLKEEGEKWMKDTANSCIIAASLIATVVFAAGITVPGGNNSNTGFPLLKSSIPFIIFAISDVVSLFTSITSLLMFLSIMTSRYAEEDFLVALPKRLCIGLLTLFHSIFFMMVAFCASTYMVFGQQDNWVLIPVLAALACLPISSFALLQFPLLVDVVSSTYGRGIFVKQIDQSPFY